MKHWLAAAVPLIIAIAAFLLLWPSLERAPFNPSQLAGLVVIGILLGIAWGAIRAAWRRHHR